MKPTRHTAILLVSSPDQKGLVAHLSAFLLEHNANILHADHHLDTETQLFLMRVEWDLAGFALTPENFATEFEKFAHKYKMTWSLSYSQTKRRVAILVSKYDHCLTDLLYRQHSGEIHCEIPLIIGNHPNARSIADFYKTDFHVIETKPEKKPEAEAQQLKLLQDHQIDPVVLARYMQILSPDFVKEYPQRIINIHHSFLPAFLGAKPYHRAFERGVKLIGATSHYVTNTLDDGPIIEQDVVRISHRDTVDDLLQKGRDLERSVLSRAVRWHLESRILVYGNKTVVFN